MTEGAKWLPILAESMPTTVDEQQMKELIKAAVTEVLLERRDLLPDALEETLEDIALARAIAEGEAGGGRMSRDEVFAILQGAA